MTVRTFSLIPRLPHAQPVLLFDFLLCILHLSLGKSNQFVKHLPVPEGSGTACSPRWRSVSAAKCSFA